MKGTILLTGKAKSNKMSIFHAIFDPKNIDSVFIQIL